MDLVLVKREEFNGVTCDFYSGTNYNVDIWMTRKQIGEALEYSNPSAAIKDIHARHKERFDMFSRVAQIALPSGGKQNTIIYSAKGIYEICRWSNQPKADMFMDWCWEVIEKIRKGRFQAKTSRNMESFAQELIKEAIESVTMAMVRIVPVVIKETVNAVSTEEKSNNIKEDTDVIPMRRNHKVNMLPVEMKTMVDKMLASPQRNFAYISRVLRSKGFSISCGAINRYFRKHFTAVHVECPFLNKNQCTRRHG